VENRFLLRIFEELVNHIKESYCFPPILLLVVNRSTVMTYRPTMTLSVHLQLIVIHSEYCFLDIVDILSKTAIEASS